MHIFGFRDLVLVLGFGPFLALSLGHSLWPQLSCPSAHPSWPRGSQGLLNHSANPSLNSACSFC